MTAIHKHLLSVPGAKMARAFGSRTKGTSTRKSDLDIALIGNIDRTDPAVLSAIVDAQELATKFGVGTGKGLRPLDITVTPSIRSLKRSFLSNPDYDPSLGIPKFKRLR